MRNLFFPFLLTCCFFSCSDDNGKDGPEPVNPGELVLTVDDAPSRVKVGTTAEFTLKAVQDGRTDAFPLRIDTVGHFSLTLNNVSYPGVSSLNPDADVLVKFTPLSVGENRITFNLTGSDSKKLSKVVSITSFLPEVSMSFSSVGDSVSVKDVTEFTFTVDGDDGEEYEVRIDTVVPEFKWDYSIYEGNYVYPGTLLHRGVDLAVNGASFPDVLNVKSGEVNTLSFSNPQSIGDYHILFTVTDKYGNGKEYEKVIRAYSPEKIVIDFLEVDPYIELGFGWEPELYYAKLNEHFDYYSLPSYFDGKHVDTIYTVEEDMVGHPGETTIPGRGMIVYIGQGEEPELFVRQVVKNNILSSHWDNDDHSVLQKTGLHALVFRTNPANNNPGVETYTLTIADKWGKTSSKTLTIIALPYGSEMPYPDNVWRRRYDWTTHVDPVK